jgi:ATP-dependent helicase/nuclease subunit B
VARPDVSEPTKPRLYTIPQTTSFLHRLARAILAGDLPREGGPAPGAEDLSRMTLLLPTRRACRNMRDAFLAESGAAVLLLPRIRALGDVDEEASFFAAEAAGETGPGVLELPEAIGAMDRRLLMMELILAWSAALGRERGPATSPAQAAHLATELSRLLDMVETEQADLSGLERLVPERFADHWQQTMTFLDIVTRQWPEILKSRGQMTPYARRNLLMLAEAQRLAEAPPADPIIAAGSTGSIPATAELLGAIARAPNGAVVLPGLDLDLDAQSWDEITDNHPEHYQFGMQQLLLRIDAARSDVSWLAGCAPRGAGQARLKLISEAMRPAGTTERWRELMADESRAQMSNCAQGIAKIEAPTSEDEAELVALIMRRVMEEPEQTAALVTPDRTLARRVMARMAKWSLEIDDSAGKPLGKSPPGIFMELIVQAAQRDFAPVPLLALMKHPLARLGRSAAAIREAARTMEIAALRGVVPADGIDGISRALARSRRDIARGEARAVALRRLSDDALQDAQELLDDVAEAFAPLVALYQARERHTIAEIARAHVAVAEALARNVEGDEAMLWRGEAGETLAAMFAELLAGRTMGPAIAARDYGEVYSAFVAPLLVRQARGEPGRLFIWGPLEARLQSVDVVILGGLNEGVWPRTEEVDAWFSRPMREQLGLPAPERRLGLSAHDVAQLLGGGRVYLTRALKDEGVPSVPSRWLLRLEAVLSTLGQEEALEPRDPWLDWARARDRVQAYAQPVRPRPCPPVEARPRRLSVTRIEDWIANPYAVFARDILKLEPLGDLAAPPDAAMRGKLVHEALARFSANHPQSLPDDIAGEVMSIASALFEELGANASVRAFWRPQFERFAQWFAETEPGRRADIQRSLSEVRGGMAFDAPAGSFELTARADRIDLLSDGALAIYDYKTGKPPAQAEVADGRAPQLPLEAAIARAGGFEGVPAADVKWLRYVWASGGRVAGQDQEASKIEPIDLADGALNDLHNLVTQFDQPNTAYAALRRRQFARKFDFDAFAHLARVPEWSLGIEGD